MGEEGKANALTDVSVSSMSDNLICPGSNLQKNMGNVLRENDDEIMRSMKMEKTGSWKWCKRRNRWNDIYE